MTIIRSHLTAGVWGAGVLAVLLVHPAWAQDDDSREGTYRGVFASTTSSAPPSLEMRWSVLGAYDDNVTADGFGSSGDPRYQLNGAYASAAATLAYNVKQDRSSFAAHLNSMGNYYPDLKSLSAFDGAADMAFTRQLGRTRSVRVSGYQGLQYRPYYQMNFLAGIAPSRGSPVRTRNDAITSSETYEYQGRIDVSKTFRSRQSLNFEYAHRSTWFSDAMRPFRWHTGTTRYTRSLTRFAAVRLGYSLGKSEDGLAGTRPMVVQDIDVGIAYDRPVAANRRTGYSFSSGSSVIDYQGQRHYRLLAEAVLSRELGRSWNARASYNRGVQVMEGIPGPLYADTVQLRLGGFVGRRTDLNFTAAYSGGQLGLGTADPGFTTLSALAGVRFALNQRLSVEMQHVYYQYGFGQTTVLPSGVPVSLDRYGARIGITGWLPLRR